MGPVASVGANVFIYCHDHDGRLHASYGLQKWAVYNVRQFVCIVSQRRFLHIRMHKNRFF